ncbi:MAG: hypothetical protein CMB11_04605 [Euryarchaeota archaeon]|nr:hypothetical protein [Euryarchaeota archaeon]
MISFFAVFVGHVPQYDGCDHNCCHPPHDPTTSQVAYLKGSGGVEFDASDFKEDYLDFNFVFKKDYDVSTFSMFAGCGGCASERPFHFDEPLSLPLAQPATYHSPKFEPFTQHAYYELLPKGEGARQLNLTAALDNCSSHHVSLRIIVHANATEEIVWGAVVGCEGLECERFTPLELISFPIYVIRNHGSAWNNAAWTLPLIAVLVPLLMALILWWWWGGWLAFYVPHGPSFPRQLARMMPNVRHWADLKLICWTQSVRLFFYAVAVWAIVVDIFETLAHTLIAARVVPTGDMGYGIFVFWFGLKWVLLACVALPWMWAREVPEELWRNSKFECRCSWFEGLGPFSPFWAQGGWSLLDICIGVGALFVGAGFYVYPVAATLAGLLRLGQWLTVPTRADPPCKYKEYVPESLADTGCGYPSNTPALFVS